MNEEIKKASKEEVDKQKQTKQESEDKKKMDNEDELKTLQKQLKNDEVNLNGGSVRVGAGIQNLISLDKRIARRKRDIEKVQIMRDEYAPIEVKFKFENNARFKAIAREELKEQQESMQEDLKNLEELKTEITERIPKTKKRINEVEKELGMEITNFEEKSPEYIG